MGDDAMKARRLTLLGGVLLLAMLLCGCPSAGRGDYQKGVRAYDDMDYQLALDHFDKALEQEPDGLMIKFGRAQALFKLERHEDALAAFETFLQDSESERASFRDERKDAAFYRDKCKQALGIEIEQNKDAIPPPPMGE